MLAIVVRFKFNQEQTMTKYVRMVRHGKVISCPIPDKFETLDDFEVWATYHVGQGT